CSENADELFFELAEPSKKGAAADQLGCLSARRRAQRAVGGHEPGALVLRHLAAQPVVRALAARPDRACRRLPVEDEHQLVPVALGPRFREPDELLFREVRPAGAEDVAGVDEDACHQAGAGTTSSAARSEPT